MTALVTPPGQEVVADKDTGRMLPAWLRWFTNLYSRLPLSVTLTKDFGNISAQSQLTQTVSLPGVQVGDRVTVTPTTAVNGIITDGTVTATDVVTVRVVNYSSGAIDPTSQDYHVMVFPQ